MISSAVQSMMSTYRWASKLMAGARNCRERPVAVVGRLPAPAVCVRRRAARGRDSRIAAVLRSAKEPEGPPIAAPPAGPAGGCHPVLVPGALSEEEEEEDLTAAAAAAAPARSRVPVPAAFRLRGRTWTPPAGS